MLLGEFLETVYCRSRILSAGGMHQLRVAVRLLDQFLGRPALLSDFSEDLLADFVRWMLSQGRSPYTANGRRDSLLTLWRAAYKKGLVPRMFDEVARAREPKLLNPTYRDEQFALLIRRLPEFRHGIIIRAVLLTAWDTCCRISAVLGAKPEHYIADRSLLVLFERKTLTERAYALSQPTVEAIQACEPIPTSLFGWRFSIDTLRDHLTAIQRKLGLPSTRKDKFHKVRRTKYTRVYTTFGKHAAGDHAGHSSDMSAYYLDTTELVTRDIPNALPPPV